MESVHRFLPKASLDVNAHSAFTHHLSYWAEILPLYRCRLRSRGWRCRCWGMCWKKFVWSRCLHRPQRFQVKNRRGACALYTLLQLARYMTCKFLPQAGRAAWGINDTESWERPICQTIGVSVGWAGGGKWGNVNGAVFQQVQESQWKEDQKSYFTANGRTKNWFLIFVEGNITDYQYKL